MRPSALIPLATLLAPLDRQSAQSPCTYAKRIDTMAPDFTTAVHQVLPTALYPTHLMLPIVGRQ